MPAQFTVDPAGIERLLTAAQAQEATRKAAAAIVTEAEQDAPNGFMGYKKSLHVGETTVENGAASTPAQSSSPVWHLVEFGTARQPARRVLTRAAQTVTEFKEAR